MKSQALNLARSLLINIVSKTRIQTVHLFRARSTDRSFMASATILHPYVTPPPSHGGDHQITQRNSEHALAIPQIAHETISVYARGAK